ncbi:MAG: molybdopterin cofactor-binding domain-containing protein, partial [Candidatus Acidiferrales bacterium]
MSRAANTSASRREFLKVGAAGGAGLLIAFYCPALVGDAAGAANAAGADSAIEPNAFITIGPSGEVRLVITRSEMGQGVRTSLAMILAEELDADWARVRV